jgi:ABC-type antimicrobial peptide transport system permease subunit
MTHSKEIAKMKKIITVALVLGVLLLTGFSMDNQSPKKASQTNSAANDYANYTQYMQ